MTFASFSVDTIGTYVVNVTSESGVTGRSRRLSGVRVRARPGPPSPLCRRARWMPRRRAGDAQPVVEVLIWATTSSRTSTARRSPFTRSLAQRPWSRRWCASATTGARATGDGLRKRSLHPRLCAHGRGRCHVHPDGARHRSQRGRRVRDAGGLLGGVALSSPRTSRPRWSTGRRRSSIGTETFPAAWAGKCAAQPIIMCYDLGGNIVRDEMRPVEMEIVSGRRRNV